MAVKVNDTDLYWNEHFDQLLYKGAPFTGLAYESFPDGRVERETEFVDGVPNGLRRTWYSTGAIESECMVLGEALHGHCRWYDLNGRVKAEGQFELGVCLQKRRWDSDGNVVEDYRITPDEKNFELLLALRRLRAAQTSVLGEKR